MRRQPIKINDVAHGLETLIRDVRTLQREVKGLSDKIKLFKDDAYFDEGYGAPPPEMSGGGSDEKRRTDEPRSVIESIRREVLDDKNAQLTTRAISVIAREIDGSLQDIRAARSDLGKIMHDADERDLFREWQSQGGQQT